MRAIVIRVTILLSIALLSSCEEDNGQRDIVILPKPVLMEQHNGVFKLDNTTGIHVTDNPALNETARLFVEMIGVATGFEPAIDNNTSASGGIILELTDTGLAGDESYILEVDRRKIHILSSSPAGIFYGIQTVRQLLPPEFESQEPVKGISWDIPCLRIEDYPVFEWRGMHLDVSRHFFPVEFIKRYIDLIAMHKMNTFHWHLVDDQGWRIEIRKYPRLTGIGAWRVDHEDKPWNAREPQKPGEVATYGGFYTQDEIKDIVKYAADRYVTIVPEIEMPAHVSSALAAYPQYSCTGNPITVPPGGLWPLTDIYCAGKDETFEFLEDILTEVMELFPSEYIHVGGDEANKTEWKKCPDCQRRIKEEGLKDEAELQSYFIKRIEKFLSANNRKLIGWDEILEGGLAPGAAVMSWRGMEGGIEAARSGHQVVMSPGTHCYFDYYQGDPSTEPRAFGGYITLKKVYSFNPVPEYLNEDEAKYIMGAQANLWTEYIHTGDHAEYMVLPRMTALSEALWLPQDRLDWEDFSRRIYSFFKRFEIMGFNYSMGSYRVDMEATYDEQDEMVKVIMASEFPNAVIHYTLDGSEPDSNSEIYSEPITLQSTTEIKAALVIEDESAGTVTSKQIYINKATGRNVEYSEQYSNKYKALGELTLVNGIKGSLNFADGQWQGFEGNNLDVKIDLEELTEITSVSVSFLSGVGSWVFLPEYVLFQVSSDGENFEDLASINNDLAPREQDREIKEFSYAGEARQARYVRVFARSIISCPPWHAGAGDKAWIFADEVIIK